MKTKWLILLIALSVYGSTQVLKKRDPCAGSALTVPGPSPTGFPGPLFLLNL